MDTHKNAPLTPKGREMMVRAVIGGLSKPAVARRFTITPKTVAKWVNVSAPREFDGLHDRSSRPRCESAGPRRA
jgi:transposase